MQNSRGSKEESIINIDSNNNSTTRSSSYAMSLMIQVIDVKTNHGTILLNSFLDVDKDMLFMVSKNGTTPYIVDTTNKTYCKTLLPFFGDSIVNDNINRIKNNIKKNVAKNINNGI